VTAPEVYDVLVERYVDDEDWDDALPAVIDLADLRGQVDRWTGKTAALDSRVERYARASKSANTLRAYRSDLAHFISWLDEHGVTRAPTPPIDVARYLAWCADSGLAASTIERRLAAISWMHHQLNTPAPTTAAVVGNVMSGIRRDLGTAPTKKNALSAAEITLMVDTARTALLPRPHRPEPGQKHLTVEQLAANAADSLARRDIALLLLGFAAGARRGELVDLKIGDLDDDPDGLIVTIRRSKTDQEGKGRKVGIVYHPSEERLCPVRQTRAWIAHLTSQAGSRPSDLGPLFRRVHNSGTVQRQPISGDTVARIVTDRALAAGVTDDPTKVAGHSLRRGFIVAASQAGVALDHIADHVGHVDQNTTRDYRIDANVMINSPARHIWDATTA
jgi:integrase